jgi:hypothetical protein
VLELEVLEVTGVVQEGIDLDLPLFQIFLEIMGTLLEILRDLSYTLGLVLQHFGFAGNGFNLLEFLLLQYFDVLGELPFLLL